ncbi:MAG TPA: hypothetical protein VHO24_07355 [Opitutaceae bacterium]|nr:hypothetical protein [Opitutaceae bacterium]
MSHGNPTEEIEALRKQVASCASWFYWIAGMTVINCMMIQSGSDTSFVIGLTVGMVVDAMAASAGATAKLFAAGFDAICVAGLIFLGVKARRGLRWAFIAGIVLYGMDTLLSLVAPNAISIGVHAWALFSMGMGLRVAGKLQVAESAAALPPVLGSPVVASSSALDPARAGLSESKQVAATSSV